jgi:2'-5' RNA ligase
VLRGGDGVAGLVGLYRELASAVLGSRVASSVVQAFTPHMTLFYGSPLAHVDIEPIEWTATEFVLIRSEMRSGKPYEVLDRWALRS